MRNRLPDLLGIGDRETPLVGINDACVATLATGFGIERCMVEDNDRVIARC